MEYTADQLKRAYQLGALEYNVYKCFNVLELDDFDDFELDFNNPASEFKKNYQRGKDMADFAIDTALFNLAKGGDIDASKELEERKQNYEICQGRQH